MAELQIGDPVNVKGLINSPLMIVTNLWVEDQDKRYIGQKYASCCWFTTDNYVQVGVFNILILKRPTCDAPNSRPTAMPNIVDSRVAGH